MIDQTKPANPSVFISYAHEGDLSGQVAVLAAYLTDNGVQAITDHPYTNRPPEIGWRAWMQHNIEDADMALVVCSERYKKLFEKREIDDSGGLGAAWESAIITHDLYQSRIHNRRFYPILPDDGDDEHVPALLVDWHNNHRFPSGRSGILSLIRDEIYLPTPTQAMQRRLPGELSGADDPRLQAREGEVIGRTDELAQVANFLSGGQRSGSVCGHITGSGGIGKTEVCKAALKQWLQGKPDCRFFYLSIADDADHLRLIMQLAQAIGLPDEQIASIRDISPLAPLLPNGLYYLDNLESVAETAEGKQLLRQLVQLPGIRLLASSRVLLDGVLGDSIVVGPLDIDSAIRLFNKCWNGSELPDTIIVQPFVEQKLGCHALCITLLARLGRAYSLENIIQRRQQQGTALAERRNSTDRLDSVEISFAITQGILKNEAGALDLWQFVALFADGVSQHILDQWENISGQQNARIALLEHNILSENAGQMQMLPPLARYALGQNNVNGQENSGFDWQSTRQLAYGYFMVISHTASNTVSDTDSIRTRTNSSQQLWAIEQLIKTDRACGEPDKEAISRLHYQLHSEYGFNVSASYAVLEQINQLLGDALSESTLGDLENRLGNIELALGHYEAAFNLYEKEQNQLGLANTLRALGDLETRLGNIGLARNRYEVAIELYLKKQARLGLANALKALGDLERRTGNLDLARGHYDSAIELYQNGHQNGQVMLGLANALQALGDLESRLGNVALARGHYNKATELYQNEQDRLGLANTLQSLGGECRGHYDKTIDLHQEAKHLLGLANAFRALGDLENRLGNVELARSHYPPVSG